MELQPKRILIVDDEPDFAMMLSLTLEQTGRYETRQECDSNLALEAAREFQPDLVLLDVMMPDLDGGDVLAQFRADPQLNKVPVIYLTALVTGDETRPNALSHTGKQLYFGKPLDFDMLTAAIDEHLMSTEQVA